MKKLLNKYKKINHNYKCRNLYKEYFKYSPELFFDLLVTKILTIRTKEMDIKQIIEDFKEMILFRVILIQTNF
jgi:hypothetical protein